MRLRVKFDELSISVARGTDGVPVLVLSRGFYTLTVECTDEQLASLARLVAPAELVRGLED